MENLAIEKLLRSELLEVRGGNTSGCVCIIGGAKQIEGCICPNGGAAQKVVKPDPTPGGKDPV